MVCIKIAYSPTKNILDKMSSFTVCGTPFVPSRAEMRIYRISYKIQNFHPFFRILDVKSKVYKRCTKARKVLKTKVLIFGTMFGGMPKTATIPYGVRL